VAGGYFIWLRLPQPLQASDLARRAMEEENLQIAAGPLFVVQGDPIRMCENFEEYVRISFAWEDPKNLTEGVRRLANTVRRAIRQD
jgi:DNA-binding transcriptional MocR family regulator